MLIGHWLVNRVTLFRFFLKTSFRSGANTHFQIVSLGKGLPGTSTLQLTSSLEKKKDAPRPQLEAITHAREPGAK